jgi:hypothetical protein
MWKGLMVTKDFSHRMRQSRSGVSVSADGDLWLEGISHLSSLHHDRERVRNVIGSVPEIGSKTLIIQLSGPPC